MKVFSHCRKSQGFWQALSETVPIYWANGHGLRYSPHAEDLCLQRVKRGFTAARPFSSAAKRPSAFRAAASAPGAHPHFGKSSDNTGRWPFG